MLDYEPSPVREDMDVIVIYLSSMDYSLVGDDEVLEMSFGPHDAVFQRSKDSKNHLKPLYIRGVSQRHSYLTDAHRWRSDNQFDAILLLQEDGQV
jgi:hypothetical protein